MSNQIKELLQKIRTLSAKQSAVIGICGLPGSGKTTLSRFLAPEFSDAVVVSADDFCILPTSLRKSFLSQALQENDAECLRYLAKPTHAADNPYANPLSWYDWQALAECLRRIKSGQEVRRPNAWNQQTGEL